jgi:hypothetical protein
MRADVARKTMGARTEPNAAELAALPKHPPIISVDQTTAILKDINNSVNSKDLASIIQDTRLKRIATALQNDPASIRFEDLRRLRTWVREAQKNPELRQSIDQGSLQRLEGALTGDIYRNANNLGGNEAENALRSADEFYRNGTTHIKETLQPFMDKPSGESTYSRILDMAGTGKSADVQSLGKLLQSLSPQTRGDVVANILAEMGRPAPGAATAGEEAINFSPSKFATEYNKLSQEARNLLFGKDGPYRKKLDDIALTASRLKAIERAANHSRTASHTQLLATGAGLFGPTAPVTALPTATGLGGLAGTGEYLTNPALAKGIPGLALPPLPNVGVMGVSNALSRAEGSLPPIALPRPSTAAAEDQDRTKRRRK